MSAPIFAAVLNRLNEERLALGKTTVGFVLPTFYKHPKIFQDVTIGTNPGCGVVSVTFDSSLVCFVWIFADHYL